MPGMNDMLDGHIEKMSRHMKDKEDSLKWHLQLRELCLQYMLALAAVERDMQNAYNRRT